MGRNQQQNNLVHLCSYMVLAAYRISQMGYCAHGSVFKTLLSDPRFTAVLHFYAGFAKLTKSVLCRRMVGL